MDNKYKAVNIHDLLDENSRAYIGEDALIEILSDFSCKPNMDVEYFLLHNAIEFTKKSQSVTYLVFDGKTGVLVGYFALAIKPITVSAGRLSNHARRRIERVSTLDEAGEAYTLSAYLIAQLGKNYAVEKEMQISGEELLRTAYEKIKLGKLFFGGVIAFLECDDVPFLIDFYQKNGHTLFNERETGIQGGHEPHILYQLMKFV